MKYLACLFLLFQIGNCFALSEIECQKRVESLIRSDAVPLGKSYSHLQLKAIATANKITKKHIWRGKGRYSKLSNGMIRSDFNKGKTAVIFFTDNVGDVASYMKWTSGQKEYWCAND